MKTMSFILIIFLSGNILPVFSNADDEKLSQELPSHPRLFWFENEENAVHTLIRSDTLWTQLYEDILKECDRFLTMPLLEYRKEGIRLMTASAVTLQRISYLAFAYRMTKEGKYLQRAEEELLTVCRFADWNPGHFLDPSEMTVAVSIGYDWLYPHLQEETKEIIRESIIRKALLPSMDTTYNWFLRAKTNWNQVCNAGMILGALVIKEQEPDVYRTILKRSLESVKLPMQQYAPDGAYPEGYAYWEYGTTYTTLLLSALEKIYGTDFGISATPGFLESARYYLHMTGNFGKNFNFGDCDESYGLAPAMFWFAGKTGDLSLLWFERRYMERTYRKNFSLHRALPLIFIWSTKTNITTLPAPSVLMWSGNGETPVALMRTSWTDPDAIFVGFKGGTARTSHAHMDAGSFVMESDGVRWAMDPGKQDYRSLEARNLKIWNNSQESDRWKVFRYTNYVHNTITINNKLHLADGYVPLVTCKETPEKMTATANLSGIFPNDLLSCKRQIAVIDKEYVVVQDEAETFPGEENTLFRWNVFTSASIHLQSKDMIKLTKDGQTLFMKIIAGNHPVTLQTWSTQSPNEYDVSNPGTSLVGFECLLPPGEKVRFSVFLIPGKAYVTKKDSTFSDRKMIERHVMQK